MIAAALLLATTAAAPATAPAAPVVPPSLQQRVEAILAGAGPGLRVGLLAVDDTGREIVAIAPDQRFIPASNTKMFTTAAAYDALGPVDAPDVAGGAAVRLEANGGGAPDVVLEGFGDARLSSAPDCVTNCLSALADAVAARTREVRDVVGDASVFPDERWPAGMSWNNIDTRSGTAVAALVADDNELRGRALPGRPGEQPRIELPGYYRIDNRAVTVRGGDAELQLRRLPGDDVLHIDGTVGPGGEALRIGIDDPAHYAAWRLRALLEARGVKVTGAVAARYRPWRPADDPAQRGGAPAARPPHAEPLAKLVPPPLADTIRITNKVSQNLYSELLLRRVGLSAGSGSVADGQARLRAMLEKAGVTPAEVELWDGSGMSTYNRTTPRGAVKLLRWIATQPWGEAWRATLPVAGVDGTLARRFRGTAAQGRLSAKTGTLNATNAVAGYLTAASGRTLTVAVYANDVPSEARATPAMDAALALIAAEN